MTTSFAAKHNVKPNPFTFKTPEMHPFKKPAELVNENGIDKTYIVRAMYVNKGGQFGDEPVIVTDEFILNAPSHILDTVRGVIDDSESCHLINDGEVAFKLYEYKNKYGQQFSVTWVDVE